MVHGLMIRGSARVVDEASATDVDSTGEEGHTDRPLVSYALKGTDEVGSLKILMLHQHIELSSSRLILPSTHASTGP